MTVKISNFVLLLSLLARAQVTPVIDAVHKGHAVGHEKDGLEAIDAALSAGGNVNERDKAGWTPLMHAALECRADEMKLLLDKGGDPSLRGVSTDKSDFVHSGLDTMLVAAGCFISRRRAQLAPERQMDEQYVAYELSAAGKMVRLLISHRADVNTADVYGRTPLMMAAMQNWPDAIRALLDAHANVNVRDRAGRSVLDYADPGDKQVVGMFEAAGAPSASGRSGRVVCDAEVALDKLGYHMPITDCIDGTQFAGGLRKFQEEHGQLANGELDSPTLNRLGVRQ